jgi:hypothetical protein
MNKYETRWGERHIQLLRLRELIKRKYRTVERFADEVGSHPSELSRVLSGNQRVAPHELGVWSGKLKITDKKLVEMLGGTD